MPIKKILTEDRINALAKTIHQMNVDKGFWDSGSRDFQQITMLNLTEISEALESHRKGEQAIFIEDGKPEGWVVEIADCAIRILDTIGGIDKVNFNFKCSDPIIQFLYDTTEMIFMASKQCIQETPSRKIFQDNKDLFLTNLKSTLYVIDTELEERGFNLTKVIEQKLEYNKTRSQKHGKQF